MALATLPQAEQIACMHQMSLQKHTRACVSLIDCDVLNCRNHVMAFVRRKS